MRVLFYSALLLLAGCVTTKDDPAQKIACGEDFRRIMVGMNESRMLQCSWAAHRVVKEGTTTGRDGVVTIYKVQPDTRTFFVYTANGKVIRWSQV